jgi:hypothetical protein
MSRCTERVVASGPGAPISRLRGQIQVVRAGEDLPRPCVPKLLSDTPEKYGVLDHKSEAFDPFGPVLPQM